MASGPLILPHQEEFDMVKLARRITESDDDTIAVVQYIQNDNDTVALCRKVKDVALQIREHASAAVTPFGCYDDAISLEAGKYTWHIFGLTRKQYTKLKTLLDFSTDANV